MQSYGCDGAGREPAHDPAGRVPAGRATRASSAPSHAIERELMPRRLRAALPRRRGTRTSTGCRPARAPSCACTFWLADNLRAAGPARRGAASSSSGCSRCATTSGCSPRSTTPRRGGWSATSPRRSPTSRSSTRPTSSRARRRRAGAESDAATLGARAGGSGGGTVEVEGGRGPRFRVPAHDSPPSPTSAGFRSPHVRLSLPGGAPRRSLRTNDRCWWSRRSTSECSRNRSRTASGWPVTTHPPRARVIASGSATVSTSSRL